MYRTCPGQFVGFWGCTRLFMGNSAWEYPSRPSSSSQSLPSRPNSSSMGRSATKSVARVYCDVNNRLGSSWYEYGTISQSLAVVVSLHFTVVSKDNLQVQWGSQDHYEIVRKVGRGKYSEVSQILVTWQMLLKYSVGLRGCKRRHGGEVHYQSFEARQEEENKTRNQNFAKPSWRTECCCTIGRCPRPNIEDS